MKASAKFICLFFAVIIMMSVFTVIPLTASAQEVELNDTGVVDEANPDYEYELLSDDTVQITEYLGNGGIVVIPPYLGGYPVTQIGARSFEQSSSRSLLIGVSIPDSVTEIGWYAFGDCTALRDVNMGNGVTRMNGMAFSGCNELRSISIGSSLSEFDPAHNNFSGCGNLETITVSSANTTFDSRDNCNAVIDSYTNELLLGCQNTTIPDSVTAIADYACYDCVNLTAVHIPASVKRIGNHAFAYCEALKDIQIPDSTIDIGVSAFDHTAWYTDQPDGLVYVGKVAYAIKGSCPEEVIIKEGTKAICDNLFASYPELKSIDIPKSVSHIGLNVFNGCSGLELIHVAEDNPVFDSRNDCNAIIRTGTNELIYGCRHTVIPDTVTSIGDRAFYGWSHLSHIYIPDSVTSIGRHAFGRCSELKSVTIPRSVTYIGDDAFGVNFDGIHYIPTKDFTIYGDSGTAAEQYAKRYRLPFASPDLASHKLGDSDGDGEITIMDATIIQRHLSMLNPYMDEPTLMQGDVDQNGRLEICDVLFITRYLSGMDTAYPIGK